MMTKFNYLVVVVVGGTLSFGCGSGDGANSHYEGNRWLCPITEQTCKEPGPTDANNNPTCAVWNDPASANKVICVFKDEVGSISRCEAEYCTACKENSTTGDICRNCTSGAPVIDPDGKTCSTVLDDAGAGSPGGAVGGGADDNNLGGPSDLPLRFGSGKYKFQAINVVATPTAPNAQPVTFEAQQFTIFEDDLVGANPGSEPIWYANTAGTITKGDFSSNIAPLPSPSLTTVDASSTFAGAAFSVFTLAGDDAAFVASGTQTSRGSPETGTFTNVVSAPGTVVDIFAEFNGTAFSVLTTAPVTIGGKSFSGQDPVAVALSGGIEFVLVNDDAGAHLLQGGTEVAVVENGKGYSLAVSSKYWAVGTTSMSNSDPAVAIYENGVLKYYQPVSGKPEMLLLRGDLLYAATRSGALQIEPFDIANPTPITMMPIAPYNLENPEAILRMSFPLDQTDSTVLPAFLWVLTKD